MQFTINGTPAELKIEKEQNLGELLSNLEIWLENKGYSMSSLTVNGNPISAETLESVYPLRLSTIQSLDIQASNWTELLYRALIETKQTIANYKYAPLIEQQSIVSTWQSSAAGRHLAQHDRNLYEMLIKDFTENNIVEAEMILQERCLELETPEEQLKQLVSQLNNLLPQLETISLAFQIGNDGKAAEILKDFSLFFEKLIRIVSTLSERKSDMQHYMVQDQSFPDFIHDFYQVLVDLLSSYERQDTVLVGDLAEYELVPRLKALQETLLSVTK
jgi:hypothetical protein